VIVVAVVTLVTVMILVTVVTVVTVVTKKLNLPKTYLPTYLPVTVVTIRTVVTVVTEVTKKKFQQKNVFTRRLFSLKIPLSHKKSPNLFTQRNHAISHKKNRATSPQKKSQKLKKNKSCNLGE
jgi:hypothetical protein